MFSSFLNAWTDIMHLLSQIAAIRAEVQDDRETIKRALQTYKVLSAYGLEMTHFTGITLGDNKFLYCPVGNIVSWSEGDYNHKYCHYCQKFFEEIKQS